MGSPLQKDTLELLAYTAKLYEASTRNVPYVTRRFLHNLDVVIGAAVLLRAQAEDTRKPKRVSE